MVSTPIYEVATRQQKNGQFCAEAQITGAFCGISDFSGIYGPPNNRSPLSLYAACTWLCKLGSNEPPSGKRLAAQPRNFLDGTGFFVTVAEP